MAGKDKTGPKGKGPKTGQGKGDCDGAKTQGDTRRGGGQGQQGEQGGGQGQQGGGQGQGCGQGQGRRRKGR